MVEVGRANLGGSVEVGKVDYDIGNSFCRRKMSGGWGGEDMG